MSEIKVKDKDIAVPGEILATGMDYLPSYGTYRQEENIRASKMGLVNIDGKVIKLIPLSGVYIPKRNDTIICQVSDIAIGGWRLNTFSPYPALLWLKEATSEYVAKTADLTRFFDVGDYIVVEITNVTSQKIVDVSAKGPGLRKIRGGRMLRINTHKVPRLIGKQGSMVSMIKNATDTKIIVGQNGVVWVQGEPQNENIVAEVVAKIEKESHIAGLTDVIKTYLEKRTGKTLEVKPFEAREAK